MALKAPKFHRVRAASRRLDNQGSMTTMRRQRTPYATERRWHNPLPVIGLGFCNVEGLSV
jgi:hypothetical protein